MHTSSFKVNKRKKLHTGSVKSFLVVAGQFNSSHNPSPLCRDGDKEIKTTDFYGIVLTTLFHGMVLRTLAYLQVGHLAHLRRLLPQQAIQKPLFKDTFE